MYQRLVSPIIISMTAFILGGGIALGAVKDTKPPVIAMSSPT
jgi:hypothetical protein